MQLAMSAVFRERLALAALGGITLIPHSALAAEGEADLPVVLSASRLRQPASLAPAAVTVIDREMIAASGLRQIADLMQLVPGFLVGYRVGHGPMVTEHGLSDTYSNRMQVLVDGRSVYNPFWGGVQWSELPLQMEDIERIEVVRGPNSATYGANAVLGVINIITRAPGAESGSQVSYTRGGNGIADMALRVVAGEGPWRYRLSVKQATDAGFDRQFDEWRTNTANLRADYQLSATDRLEMQAGHGSGPRGEGRDKGTNPKRVRQAEQDFAQLRWCRCTSADDETSLQYFHEVFHVSEGFIGYPDPPLPQVPVPVDWNTATQRDDIEFQQSRRLSSNLRSVWGAQLRRDAAQSVPFFNNNRWQKDNLQRFFGNLEWEATTDLVLNAGAMAERTSTAGSLLSPRFAANWQMAPGHTLRAAVSTAESTPTLYQARSDSRIYVLNILYQRISGDPGLESERVRSSELAYLYENRAAGLSLDLRAYADRADRLMNYYSTTGPALTNKSVRGQGSADLRGLELGGHWRWGPRTRFHFAYALGKITSNDVDAQYSLSQPHNVGSLLAEHRFTNQVAVSALWTHATDVKWVSGQRDAGSDRVDLRIACRFQWPGHTLEVSLVAQNVVRGGWTYAPENVPPRLAYLQAKADF